MGHIESPSAQHSECVLVVGVSRPKLAVVFLTVMLVSLFLTFHVLYDSAVYSIQVNYLSKEKSVRGRTAPTAPATQLSFRILHVSADYAFELHRNQHTFHFNLFFPFYGRCSYARRAVLFVFLFVEI